MRPTGPTTSTSTTTPSTIAPASRTAPWRASSTTSTIVSTGAGNVIGGRTFATSFDYDSRDNLERIDYHSGRYVIYDYDHADRIVTVRGSNGAGGEQVFAADVDYHPSGAIKSYTFGNGRQETLSFDDSFCPDQTCRAARST